MLQCDYLRGNFDKKNLGMLVIFPKAEIFANWSKNTLFYSKIVILNGDETRYVNNKREPQ